MVDDEESDSSDSFVVAFEAHHLHTLVFGLGRRGDGAVMYKREVVHSRDHPASTELVQNTDARVARLADMVTWL